jgi:hypothetical protein
MEPIVSSTELMKQAEHCGFSSMPQLNHTDCRVLLGGEVTALAAPVGDGGGDAADQLPDAGLALGSAALAVKILGSDNVRRGHRPGFRHLDILLLEDDFAGFAGNCRSPVFPLHCVVGRDAFTREISPEFEPFLRSRRQISISLGRAFQDFLFHCDAPPYIVPICVDNARCRGT